MERWDMYSDGWERANDGRLEQWKVMEYGKMGYVQRWVGES